MSESYDLIVIGAGPGGYVSAFVPHNWVKRWQSSKNSMLEALV